MRDNVNFSNFYRKRLTLSVLKCLILAKEFEGVIRRHKPSKNLLNKNSESHI